MRKYIAFLAILALFGCKRDIYDSSPQSISETKLGFNLKTLQEFSKQRAAFEQKQAGSGLMASNVRSANNGSEDYNDYLLWDLAVKETNTVSGTVAYLVPIKGSTVEGRISDTINEKGYRMIDFYTDEEGKDIYAQVREYRPDKDWLEKLQSEKGITIKNNEYIEYKMLLYGEPYNGHIVTYSLRNKIRKLITVKDGEVVDVNLYR